MHTLPHGYRWKVIFDPTGYWDGGIFRAIDLESETPDENGWPDGIIFQHIKRKVMKTVQNGQLINLVNAPASIGRANSRVEA